MRASDEAEAILLVDNQHEIWRQLVWLRYQNKWSPKWPTATYRELYGVWPEKWMHGLTPVPASEDLIKLITRRINKWRREKKRERAERQGAAISRGGRAAGNGTGSEGSVVDGYLRHRGGED